MTDALTACLQLVHSTARSGKIRDALMHYRDPETAWDALCRLDRSLQPGLKPKLPLLERGKQLLFARGDLLVGGLSLVLAGYLGWQGIEGLQLS